MPESKQQEINPLSWLFNPFTSAKAVFMLILLGFFVFANSMGNAFVADDLTYILRNPDIHQLNIIKLFGPNAFTSGEYYRPLSAVFFAAFYTVSGSNTFLFHFFQVVLHILTAVLFFFFLKKFFFDKLSFFLSAVFLVHPIQVESVAYISGLTNVLLLFFGLCALLITTKKKLYIQDYILLIGALFLALLAKETAVLFIALLLLYSFFFKKKLFLPSLYSGLISFLLYFFLRVGEVGIVKVQKIQANDFPIFQLDFFHRLLNIPEIFIHYLKEFFFPTTLAFMQNWVIRSASFSGFYLPLFFTILILAGLMTLGFFLYKKQSKTQFSVFVFFGVWFFASIGMLLQIVPIDGTVADRWLYPVLPGLLGLVGIGITEYSINLRIKTAHIAAGAGIIIVLFSFRTMYRNWDWQNGITLYSHDLHVVDGYAIEDAYGEELITTGDYQQAIVHLKKSMDFYVTSQNLNDLGVAYQHVGDMQNAEKAYRRALLITPPSSGISYYNLANLLILTQDRPTEGVTIMRRILVKNFPDNPRFWLLLALGEYKLGQSQQALDDAKKAQALDNSFQAGYLVDFISAKKPVHMLNTSLLQ